MCNYIWIGKRLKVVILIGKWIDHFNCVDKKAKIKMKRVKKSSQTILALNCDLLITAAPKPKVGTPARLSNADIGFFGSNLVVKSISEEYISDVINNQCCVEN